MSAMGGEKTGENAVTVGHGSKIVFVQRMLVRGGNGVWQMEESFSSPEAALLLVSTENHDLWPGPTPEVRDSRTSRHSAHAQS